MAQKNDTMKDPQTQMEPADVNGASNSQTSQAETQHPMTSGGNDRPVPQPGEMRRVRPEVGGVSGLVDDRLDAPDNFDNAGRDPQQIADDNITQYTTGRPV